MKLFCSSCAKSFSVPPEDISAEKTKCPLCHQEIPVPSSPVAPGVVIADFLIEKLISKGGMGEVYLARQISLDRPVALKVLQSKFINDKEYVDSLFREARAAAKINHPNIVQAYAVGEEEGIFYFAMEFVRGSTFKNILKEQNGKLEFRQAAKVISEVAGALNTAWKEQKLVHQDIKPDNIMLDANGFAKLADMGLAKTASMPQTDDDADEVLGTPQYISPEQLTGVPTDVRSDIYSLGATFYQFVTGRFPYVGTEAEEITKQHVEGHLTPPKEINPDVPDELNAIIIKMMARLPENRYQTPEPLIRDLENFLQHPPASSPAKPKIKLNLSGRTSLPKEPAPAGPSLKPVVPAAKTAVPTLKPVVPAAKPAVPTLKPVVPAAKPAVPTFKPVLPTGKPLPPGPSAEATGQKKAEAEPPKENQTAAPEPETKSAERKQRKSPLRWILLGCALFLFLLLGGVIALPILENNSAAPEFLRPVSKPLHTAFSRWSGSVKKKAMELSRPTIVVANKNDPEKDKPRQDYFNKIAMLKEMKKENPSAFLQMIDKEWQWLADVRTPEEKTAWEELAEAFSAEDERIRASQTREELRRQHLTAISERKAQRENLEKQKQEAARALELKQEEERRQALENERKRQRDVEHRRNQTIALQKQLNLFYQRLTDGSLSAMKNDEDFLKDPVWQDIRRYLAAAPRNDEEQKTLIRQFEVFCKELPPCVTDAQKKAKLFSQIREENGIHLTTSRGAALLVSIRWGEILCRDRNDRVFPLLPTKEKRAYQLLASRLTRRKVEENAAFYLELLAGIPGLIPNTSVPPLWKKCWPRIRESMKK